jgi:hypothetical protein
MTAKEDMLLHIATEGHEGFLRIGPEYVTEGHRYCAVKIENNTAECRKNDFAIVDMDAAVEVGDRVLLSERGVLFVRRLFEDNDGGYMLQPLEGSRQKPLFVRDWQPLVIGKIEKFLGAK